MVFWSKVLNNDPKRWCGHCGKPLPLEEVIFVDGKRNGGGRNAWYIKKHIIDWLNSPDVHMKFAYPIVEEKVS